MTRNNADERDRHEGLGYVLDPNYQDGGYWGMRMRGGDGLAAYGMHRDLRRDDLETAGGFGGIHGSGAPDALRDRYLREETGGIRDPATDISFLRDFNSRGARFGRDLGGMGEDGDDAARDRPWSVGRLAEGQRDFAAGEGPGYGESWARGPVPGSR